MPDPRLPDCAFPHCDHTSLPDGLMCGSHNHVRINPSYLEPREVGQS